MQNDLGSSCGKSWTREGVSTQSHGERAKVRVLRESEEKVLNKKQYLFLELSYSTILHLRWYCSTIVNFFTILKVRLELTFNALMLKHA